MHRTVCTLIEWLEGGDLATLDLKMLHMARVLERSILADADAVERSRTKTLIHLIPTLLGGESWRSAFLYHPCHPHLVPDSQDVEST